MIARGFHEAGATVYVSARTEQACHGVTDELGDDRAVPVPGDVATQEGCRALADVVATHTDSLDVLVNNAGVTWGDPLEQYPDSGWDKVLAINLKAPFHLTVACLDLLRCSARPDDPARVLNVGSVDGLHNPIWESYAYSASKAGIHRLTKHLAQRLAREHVTVNALAPGLFPSRMTKFVFEDEGETEALRKTIPLGRVGSPDDAAGAAIFLASPAASWITGIVLPVDGGQVMLM